MSFTKVSTSGNNCGVTLCTRRTPKGCPWLLPSRFRFVSQAAVLHFANLSASASVFHHSSLVNLWAHILTSPWFASSGSAFIMQPYHDNPFDNHSRSREHMQDPFSNVSPLSLGRAIRSSLIFARSFLCPPALKFQLTFLPLARWSSYFSDCPIPPATSRCQPTRLQSST